jgi:hypothetical protein
MRRFIFTGLILIFSTAIQAQTTATNALAFPSSNNSFLAKGNPAADVSVDLYTGKSQASIPICNLASKGISIPVSVDYADGAGVKLHEYATQVGLGWQLNAGGAISRVVRGFPDELPNGYLGTGTLPTNILTSQTQWGKLIASYVGNAGGMTSNEHTAIFGYAASAALTAPTADGEPDIFYVKTPFFSFQFVFNELGVPVFPNTTGYKIITTNFINTSSLYNQNSSFEVIDPSGNQYYFGTNVYSREQSTDSLYGVPYQFNSTWYLTQIITFNSKDVINLSYTSSSTNDTTYNYTWSEADNGSQTNTILSTGRNIVTNPKFISQIVSQLGEVDFNYTFNQRLDDHNLPFLSTIVTKAYNPQTLTNGTSLQTYTFQFGYFGTPSIDPNVLRLELTGITVAGNTTTTSTPLKLASFGYDTVTNSIVTNLPNRTWLVYDYWGHCNTTTNPPANDYKYVSLVSQSPNVTMAQIDILTSITTLQGETWQITYDNSVTGIGGVRVAKMSRTLPTGENLNKTYQYLDAYGNPSSGEIYSNLYSQLSFQMSSIITLYFTSNPYVLNDATGNFVGYSQVKEINQNGGYTLFNFSNFNDGTDADGLGFSDVLSTVNVQGINGYNFSYIPSATNMSFKRGLLLSKSVFNSAGNTLSSTTYNYSPLVSVANLKNSAYGLCIIFLNGVVTSTSYAQTSGYNKYSTTNENYRLTSVTQTDYDQVTHGNAMSQITNYGYDQLSDVNNTNRLINSITTADSKGLTDTRDIYYSIDVSQTGSAAIPMLTTGPETTTLQAMVTGNNVDEVIHTTQITNSVNSTINQKHNTFGTFQDGLATKYFITNASTYTSDPANIANTLVNQNYYYFDAGSSNLISSNSLGGKSTAVGYGYTSAYPNVKVVDASSTSITNSQTITAQGYLNFSTGTSFYSTGGNIVLSISFGSYPGATNQTFANYTLTGPSSYTGSLCYTMSGSGYSCGSTPSSITLTGYPAGSYSLTVSGSTNFPSSNPDLSFTYPTTIGVTTYTNEYFFEGFEENISATSGSAHTGNMYYNGNYTVNYSPPNSRSYLIQYWNLVGGIWNFNELPYSAGMVLTGPVDDIRVFPVDALMTSYTYNPLVGKTSETDPSGKSVSYLYDGLNRLNLVKDNDGSILKKNCYTYQGQTSSCPATLNIYCAGNNSYTTWTVSFTSTLTGQVYSFSIPATSFPNTNYQLPVGNYTVVLTPGNNNGHNLGFGNYGLSGSGAAAFTLTNIPLTSNITIYIED